MVLHRYGGQRVSPKLLLLACRTRPTETAAETPRVNHAAMAEDSQHALWLGPSAITLHTCSCSCVRQFLHLKQVWPMLHVLLPQALPMAAASAPSLFAVAFETEP